MFTRPLFAAYRLASSALGPIAPALLGWRRRHGKEDAQRVGERLARPVQPRPEGRLAWLHGASVGEGLALLPLVERLTERGFNVMLTTGTVSSAAVVAARLPAGAFHQYVPLDVPKFIRRFLDHWAPDMVLFAESELWPNMLGEVRARGTPMVLVNARLSERSFRRWQNAPGVIHDMLERFDMCLAQTPGDAARLMQLGAARVQVMGNLKYDVPPPPADAAALAQLSGQIGARPTWLAASTHAGEEDAACAAHQMLGQRFPTLLTIIAPRHAARGDAVAAEARARGLKVAQRSRGEPIARDTDIYVADTMGELGLFYRLTSLVFVGKSLAEGGGGQNPIEPAKLGAAILHGPQVQNFAEVYAALAAAGGAAEVDGVAGLAGELARLLSNPRDLRIMARASAETVEALAGASKRVEAALEPYFTQMLIESR